jgi:hypothetical protein
MATILVSRRYIKKDYFESKTGGYFVINNTTVAPHSPVTIADGSEKYLTITPEQSLSFKSTNANGLISGGVVTWDNGLDYIVSPAKYNINEVAYSTETEILTVSAADPDYPRLDIVIVDTDSTVSIIQGTPSANPVLPVVDDPSTQIVLTSILIPAVTGIPDNIVDTIVYNENLEWENGYSAMAIDTTITVDFQSNVSPFRQAYCIDVSNIDSQDYVYFKSSTALNFSDYTTLSFYIKLKELLSRFTNVRLQFYLGGTSVSNSVNISLVNLVDDWQNFAINISDFTFTDSGATFDTIRIYLVKRDIGVYTHPGFYLDYIKLQGGLIAPVTQDSIVIEGDVTGVGKLGVPLQLQLNEIITAGQFGDRTKIPVITIDTKGRITAIEEYDVELELSEEPLGDVDGINATFTLSNTPILDSCKVYLNGIRQRNDLTAYSIEGSVIEFVNTPFVGDWIVVDYRY